MYRLTILLCLLFGFNHATQAQVAKDSKNYKRIVKNDSLLFERSFNNCEMQYLEALLSEDLEFYHDISGIINSKRAFIETMKNGLCGNPIYRSRRELKKGSTEVYELKNNNKVYALIQKGTHSFFESKNGAAETKGSTAQFTHLWLLEEDGVFRLKRALSYYHILPKEH